MRTAGLMLTLSDLPGAIRPVCCAVLIGVFTQSAAGQPRTASEYELKAAFVFNFANFVVWPSTAFDGPAAPLRVCTLGDDAFAPVLAETLRNEAAGGHPLTLVRDPSSNALRQCHILFLARRAPDIDVVLKDVRGSPVLTIGDMSNFVGRGGVIEFVLDAGHVRFDVDLAAAAVSRLTLSSRLLQVARQVHR